MSSNRVGSHPSVRERHSAALAQLRKARTGPVRSRGRHVIVSVAPTQLKAIDAAAKKYEREILVRSLIEAFLRRPTRLIAGGAYYKPDRIRLGFHIDDSLHNAVANFAQEVGVPMTVVFTTAIHNRFPV